MYKGSMGSSGKEKVDIPLGILFVHFPTVLLVALISPKLL
jgi:hypothetical protein